MAQPLNPASSGMVNLDTEVCCLSVSPSLPLYSFTLPENVQLQFKPHCFIQAVCLNSFFIFFSFKREMRRSNCPTIAANSSLADT